MSEKISISVSLVTDGLVKKLKEFALYVRYLSCAVVAKDEFEVMPPGDGFSLLRRQKNLGGSLSTLCTTSCVLLDLGKYCVISDIGSFFGEIPFV